MDVASLVAAFVAMQAGQTQTAIATSVMRADANSQKEVAALVAQTAQDAAQFANLPPGVGNSVDVSA